MKQVMLTKGSVKDKLDQFGNPESRVQIRESDLFPRSINTAVPLQIKYASLLALNKLRSFCRLLFW